MLTLSDCLSDMGVEDNSEAANQIEVTRSPRSYQKEAVVQALANVRYGLYDEPGVGKTIPAQLICLTYLLMGNKALIIMPPILLKQFEASLSSTFKGVRDHFDLHILNQTPKKRQELMADWLALDSWPDMLLMSYAMFVRRVKGDGQSPRMYTRLAKHYDVIVCDEAHNLCSPGSYANKGVDMVCGKEGESALLLMTGTPTPNELVNAYGLIKLITPGVYRNKKQFDRLHVVYEENASGFNSAVGYKDVKYLTKNIYAKARRVLKSDVLSLKKPNIVELEIDLYPKHRNLYKKLVRERFLEVEGEIIDAIQAQSLRQKCLRLVANPDPFSETEIPNAMFDMLDELLDSVGVKHLEKVIVFTNYRETTEKTRDYLSHLNPAIIYGGKGNNTDQANKFVTDESCRVCVANPVSGGVGIDGMQNVCSTAIYLEPQSVPGVFTQSMDRLHRDGQKNVVNVYILTAKNTIATRLTESMLGKASEIKRVLKDRQTVLDELMGL